MSHTPGPWKAVGNQVHVGRMRICSCVTAGEQLSIGESHDRACANAHLIAASPDLLEELRRSNDLLCKALKEGGISYADWKQQTDRNEAAIKKARGES